MSRSSIAISALAFSLALILIPSAAHAQYACNLASVINCANGHCTSTTTNNGSNACTGTIVTGFEAIQDQQAILTGFNAGISLQQCFDSNTIPGAYFAACVGPGSLAAGSSFTSTVTVSATPNTPIFAFTAVEDAAHNILGLAYALSGNVAPTCTPNLAAPPVTQSGASYTVAWTPSTDPTTTYQIDESTAADFSANLVSQTVSVLSATFQHTVVTTTKYYYRVHATFCGGGAGPLSATATTIVQAPAAPGANVNKADTVVPLGSTSPVAIPLTVTIPISGKTGVLDTTYTATCTLPCTSVTPASGTIPSTGISLTAVANPTGLPAGANTATVTVTPSVGNPVSVPVSVSLVTPVTPSGKSQPPANALVIPVVTHVIGNGNTPFVSDVRLTNGSSGSINYQVSYTPANSNGTQTGQVTTITVAAGQTVALNDIAKDFFGVGATADPNDFGSGALEVRPLNSASTQTYASSRTYATTSFGTFGQFIAAVPFSQFATQVAFTPPIGGPAPTPGPAPLLSLQQVAQSAKFRTNLGLVEGSGAPASGNINVYNDSGMLLKAVPFSLQAGEQKQLNAFISSASGANLPNLDDGRIEIQVTSATGAVSAYASVLDNTTSDPLAVTPVVAAAVHSTRYVIPGIAELNTGTNFHSDIRLFNGGSSDANVTLTFYPQGNGTPVPMPSFTIPKGQVKAMDNVLPTYFNVTAGGGSIVATTTGDSSIVATGRTYSNAAAGGTYGQFIPGVIPSQGIGVGDRPLQILQLEQSQQFRSNVGVAELTGNPAHVRLTLYMPDASKVATLIERDMAPNEFFQFGSIIASSFFNLQPGTTVYNARVTVEVTSGTGRVAAYGSVIDNSSSDPTYVPAQ